MGFKQSRLGVLLAHYYEVFQYAWRGRHFDNRALVEQYESEFLPDAIELQETNSPPILTWVAYVIVFMILIALLWASIGKVDIVAIANGRLISGGYSKTIKSLGTSKVQKIVVENGDLVKAGDLLIQLDDAESNATIVKFDATIPLLKKKVEAYGKLAADHYVSEHDYQDKIKELFDAIAQREQAQFVKNSMAIKSPVDGVVTGLTIHTEGGVVMPGETLLMVVPNNPKLELEAYLDNKDVGFVKVGQGVAVKVEAFPFTRYGLIKGVVVTIANDSIERPGEKPLKTKESDLETRAQTTNNYHIKVALDKTHITVNGIEEPLLPGMVASAEIKTGKRSLISYLTSPIAESLMEAARER